MAFFFFFAIFCLLNPLFQVIGQEEASLKTYIVHVNVPDNKDFENLDSFYHSFLPQTSSSSRMVHTYRNIVNGFAARLSYKEAKTIKKKEGVLLIRPENIYPLHTTHSPNFLGLHQNLGFWKDSNYGKGVIIGLLDTGITPGHPSFSDEGVPPPPAKWKGTCQLNGTTCNNKLIGAKTFVAFQPGPPTDEEGHGTHTSSTAAGNLVKDANLFGMANGTAVGIAPLAHIAMYKVCYVVCKESDVLAAMDAAVEDGVDVLSVSLGGKSDPFYSNSIAIGAFGAIQRGIFVSCSAGNHGPDNSTLSNAAPWILSVGASTIDRRVRATALLGNKDELDGESLYQPKDFPETLLPLVFPGSNGDQDALYCAKGSLDKIDVKGKIVLCERGGGVDTIAKGETLKDASGAVAKILFSRIGT